jgi:hypothetical protein
VDELTSFSKYIYVPKLGWIKFRDEFKIPQDVEFRNIKRFGLRKYESRQDFVTIESQEPPTALAW